MKSLEELKFCYGQKSVSELKATFTASFCASLSGTRLGSHGSDERQLLLWDWLQAGEKKLYL